MEVEVEVEVEVEKKRAVVSKDSSAADLAPLAAAAEAKPAVAAPVINISANATDFAQQVRQFATSSPPLISSIQGNVMPVLSQRDTSHRWHRTS